MSKKGNSGLRPGLCTVCHHPALSEIDQALFNGMSLRPLAALYDLSPSALSRHTKHLSRHLRDQRHQDQQAQIAAALEELELLKFRLDRLFHKSEDAHSLHISLGCLQESIKLLALRTRLRHTIEGRY
jgi:hypothetical protein